jgi:pimeloyl-ACP methyl ester carboxylesterase
VAIERVRGIEVSVQSIGDGPALVWGHGLSSSIESEDELGWFDWTTVARSRRVVRYDARGHGHSESTRDGYHWRDLAFDQLALADALGIADYVAGGASMGAATALHAATVAPERIRALVLVIPPTAWATRALQADAYLLTADLVEAGEIDALLAGAAARPVPDPFIDDPRWHARYAETVRAADPTRLARVFRGAASADLPAPDEIAAITVPTLVLAWTGDPGHPVTTAARLQELIPHAELAVASTPAGMSTWTARVAAFLDALA